MFFPFLTCGSKQNILSRRQIRNFQDKYTIIENENDTSATIFDKLTSNPYPQCFIVDKKTGGRVISRSMLDEIKWTILIPDHLNSVAESRSKSLAILNEKIVSIAQECYGLKNGVKSLQVFVQKLLKRHSLRHVHEMIDSRKECYGIKAFNYRQYFEVSTTKTFQKSRKQSLHQTFSL